MTPDLRPDGREHAALSVYATDPLDAGDAVLLLDGSVCLELTGLADRWQPGSRTRLADVVAGSSRAVLAIARGSCELLPRDHQLWHELRDEVRDAPVELLPVQALPAA